MPVDHDNVGLEELDGTEEAALPGGDRLVEPHAEAAVDPVRHLHERRHPDDGHAGVGEPARVERQSRDQGDFSVGIGVQQGAGDHEVPADVADAEPVV